jgi:fucose 4-O-acetylase-like acetyltransferase
MTRHEALHLRGMACLLLLVNHIIGGTAQEGLQVSGGLLREVTDALSALRMPLFACLAGVASFHFKKTGVALLRDKAYRLLLPMLLTGTLFYILQALHQGKSLASIPWHMLHIWPVSHYWFLESLFIIIMLWSLAPSRYAKAFLTVCAMTAYVLGIGTPLLGIAGAIYLAPFFALGWWWANAQPPTASRRAQLSAWALMLVAAVIVVLNGNAASHRMSIEMLLAGALICAALMTLRPQHAILSWIGTFSYTAFLFHVFFTAATRVLLEELHISNLYVHLAIGLLVALIGSSLLHKAILMLGGPALWWIGEKPPHLIRPSQPATTDAGKVKARPIRGAEFRGSESTGKVS